MASSNSQIDKPQRERPKRAEVPGVNINTGAQSINIERASCKYRQIISTMKGLSRGFIWGMEGVTYR